MIRLDDTSGCPTAAECHDCGGAAELGVATLETTVGVFCLTLCDNCAEQGSAARIGVVKAVTLVLGHCEHLGIDADQMEALLEAERR